MSKYTAEEKLAAVKRHLENGESLQHVAEIIGISQYTFRSWCTKYEIGGPEAFTRTGYQHYTPQLKKEAVEFYLNRDVSLDETCKKFQISTRGSLRQWIMLYNGHESNASSGGRKKNMTKSRKTTLDERVSIVTDCITNKRNLKETAKHYNVSYQQVYQWVRKYKEKGIDGLVDRRGRTKPKEEMTTEEKLRAENKLLKAQLERKELENLFLKKLDEIERRRY